MIELWEFKFVMDSVGGVDVILDVFYNNTTDILKKIKYITFFMVPYNAVGDPVASEVDGEIVKKLLFTGPLDVCSKSNNICWDNVWYNKSISKICISKAVVEYMDGTFENIDGKEIKVRDFSKNLETTKTTKKGCYIATCVYNSYDCPQVWCLRRYRDNYLNNHWWGVAFIKLYYLISPTIVKIFGNNKGFRSFFKKILDKKITKLTAKGYERTRYEDKY